jgi:hypothetical protein
MDDATESKTISAVVALANSGKLTFLKATLQKSKNTV